MPKRASLTRRMAPLALAVLLLGCSASGLAAEYLIGPEDVLEIRFWQQPDLNSMVKVTLDGTIGVVRVTEFGDLSRVTIIRGGDRTGEVEVVDGAAAVFLAEMLDNSFKRVEEVEQLLDLPVLATILRIDKLPMMR